MKESTNFAEQAFRAAALLEDQLMKAIDAIEARGNVPVMVGDTIHELTPEQHRAYKQTGRIP